MVCLVGRMAFRPIPLATSPDTDEFYQQSMLIFDRLIDIQQQQQQSGADSQSNVSTTDLPTIDTRWVRIFTPIHSMDGRMDGWVACVCSGSYSHFGASQYAPSWPSMAQMIASSKTEQDNTAGDGKGEADEEGEGARERQDSQEEQADCCVDVGTRKYGLDIMLAIRRKVTQTGVCSLPHMNIHVCLFSLCVSRICPPPP